MDSVTVEFEGLEFCVFFDTDDCGDWYPCEIVAESDGSNWTNYLVPHIKGLIMAEAEAKRNGLIRESKCAAALSEIEATA